MVDRSPWGGQADPRRLDGRADSAQPAIMPGNWHTASGYSILLVDCRACGRRAVIRKEGSHRQMSQGNMQERNRQKFTCRKFGGTAIRA